jgi:hypothetical protein
MYRTGLRRQIPLSSEGVHKSTSGSRNKNQYLSITHLSRLQGLWSRNRRLFNWSLDGGAADFRDAGEPIEALTEVGRIGGIGNVSEEGEGGGGKRNVTGKLPFCLVVRQGRATYIPPSYQVLQ